MSFLVSRARQTIEAAQERLDPMQQVRFDVDDKEAVDVSGSLRIEALHEALLSLRHAILDLEAEIARRQ